MEKLERLWVYNLKTDKSQWVAASETDGRIQVREWLN